MYPFTKQETLTFLLGILPTYLSLFATSMWAAVIMSVGTGIGLYLTGSATLGGKSEDKPWILERLRSAWICHIVGGMILVAIHYTFMPAN
jgi:hypothetical protein